MSFPNHILAKLARLSLAAAILFLLGGCGSRVHPPIRIGTIVWPGYEFFYLARTLGYYEEMPVQMVEYTSSSEILRGFKNNTLEAVALTGDEFLRLAEEQPDVRAIAVLDISFGADALLSQPGITNLAQLKGKKVGVEPNSVGTMLLMYALEEADIKKEQIVPVHSENSEHEEMFRSGAIDALATFEPVKSRLLNTGANLLFDSKAVQGRIIDLLVVRKELIDKQPERLRRILAAWFKAREFYLANQSKAAELMAPREKLSPIQFIYALEGLLIPSSAENRALFQPGEQNLASRLKQMAGFLRKNSLLKTEVDPTLFLDDQILQRLP